MGDQGTGCGDLLVRAWGFPPFCYPPLIIVPLLSWVVKVIVALSEEFLRIKQRYINTLTGLHHPGSYGAGKGPSRAHKVLGAQDLLADNKGVGHEERASKAGAAPGPRHLMLTLLPLSPPPPPLDNAPPQGLQGWKRCF